MQWVNVATPIVPSPIDPRLNPSVPCRTMDLGPLLPGTQCATIRKSCCSCSLTNSRTSAIQAHLEYKVTGDKVQPKVGKHKVQEVKNHKVPEPHRKQKNVRPGQACTPLRFRRRTNYYSTVHCSYPSAGRMKPSFVCKIIFERGLHAMMKTISGVRSEKEDNKTLFISTIE